MDPIVGKLEFPYFTHTRQLSANFACHRLKYKPNSLTLV